MAIPLRCSSQKLSPALRYSDRGFGTLFREYLLLCLSAPLQSVTALASRRTSLSGKFEAPSLGFWTLMAKQARAIVMLVYLASTFHSQGFSPSQRLHPTRTSRLFFTPHPPVGSWSSELFPINQPRCLSTSPTLLLFMMSRVIVTFDTRRLVQFPF